ncbi:MmcQ/YjbR family DNA-binding protein [Mucilaginibacter sp. UR6-11]|uniref:MmcQ/YjbR family DNA-binding protein n=1 Tax=Mucilaginibacter sp. UR6-11 TaxID=1435644 RepID=UPI001E446979|nr:MmcQ/YjbR family DNA-binding protein [Mucilaginibacter sp. UR6-11]MCC8425608.1 MmcQ/YjbR family DNA-binding protein [Mucilaginibacter sp. UR6-11]
MTLDTARKIALSLPGTDEYPHFDKQAFRANNRIFATLWEPEQLMMVKLSPIDQSVFSAFNPDVIYPVPNKWGLQGCTFFELKAVREDMLTDALTIAWQAATAKKSTKKTNPG